MVYLIHFEKKFKHAQHYIGFCKDGNLKKRIKRHRKGDGAKLLRAVSLAGIEYNIVRVWDDGTQDFERRMKKTHHRELFCPICNPDYSGIYLLDSRIIESDNDLIVRPDNETFYQEDWIIR
jgi:predicted GIY-YIG superfamily endonuclease